MTVFKLPKMEKREIKKLLNEQMICRIAFKGNNSKITNFFYLSKTLQYSSWNPAPNTRTTNAKPRNDA